MSKGATAPLLITGVIVAVGNGWILAAWQTVYNWTHTGASTNPFAASGNPFAPVTVGTGGDAATGGAPGKPQVTITGTIHGSTFIPNDTKIPSFPIGPSTNEIPAGTLALVYKLFGTKSGSGGSNGVTIW